MKNQQEDKTIRERLASLENASEGVQSNKEELWKRLEKVLPPPKKKSKITFLWAGMAACMAALLSFFMIHSAAPLPKKEPVKHQMSATVKHPYLQPEMPELQSIKQPPQPSVHKRKKATPQRTPAPPARTTANKKAVGAYLVSVGGTPPGYDASISDLIAY